MGSRHGSCDVLPFHLRDADLPAAASRSPPVALGHVARLRITPLHDEPRHHAMDPLPVVKVPLDQREDVFHMLGRIGRIQLDFNVALDRFDQQHRTRGRRWFRGRFGSRRRRLRRGSLRARRLNQYRYDQNRDSEATPHVVLQTVSYPLVRKTPILGHSSLIAQSPHRGYTGRQTFCPQVTRYRLMYGHHRLAVARYRACSVSSGSMVLTHPRRLEMRWTWVSTQIFRGLLNARISTRFAVLRPTPGNMSSSSIASGTVPPKRETSISQQAFTYLALYR